MINKIQGNVASGISKVDIKDTVKEFISILDNNEYVIECTPEGGLSSVYSYRVFFKHNNRYYVRYTGHSEQSCIDYLPKIPTAASEVNIYNGAIESVSRQYIQGRRSIYKYPFSSKSVKPILTTLKDFL